MLVTLGNADASSNYWVSATNGNWSAAANWDGLPANDGSATVLFSNRTATTRIAQLDTHWHVHRLVNLGGGENFAIGQPGTAVLSVGEGGIVGDANRWLLLHPNLAFTSGETELQTGGIYFSNPIASTHSNGTLVRIRAQNWKYIQFVQSSASATNVTWSLEGGQVAIYTTDPNAALGTNTVRVGGTGGQRYIGLYGDTASNDVYWDVPVELDTTAIGANGSAGLVPLNFVFSRGSSDADNTITHVRGPWRTKDGAAWSNTGGIGAIQLYGKANDDRARNYYEADNQALPFGVTTAGGWNGDLAINSGIHVLNAPHAFGTSNSMTVNLADQSGGLTATRRRALLATAGNHVAGKIRIYGGSAWVAGDVTNRAVATVGLEGPGTVEFAGKVLLNRWPDLGAASRVFDAELTAPPGGTARFAGPIEEVTIGGTAVAPAVSIAGGGTVELTAASTYTQPTTVRSNATLLLNGSLTSPLTIETNATLSGTGTVFHVVDVAGRLQPGNGIGTFTVASNAILRATSELHCALDVDSDRLAVAGTLDIAGGKLVLSGGRSNTTYTVATFAGRTGAGFGAVDTTGLNPGLRVNPAQITYGTTAITLIVRPLDQFYLDYAAGPHGALSGAVAQVVASGGTGTPVTASANANCHFVQWSDGRTDNSRTDSPVTNDVNVTAQFAVDAGFYSLVYTAGPNGTVSGATAQVVAASSNGTPVTAVPVVGYHFTAWSDGVTTNPRAETNVVNDLAVTANFAINTYTLTYTAGTNGTISGPTPQTINHGGSGTAVTAVPSTNYRFVNWSDGLTANPRTDTPVTSSLTVTANFALVQYTLTYLAGPNGSISGQTAQVVNHGAHGATVTPVPALGYRFHSWSDYRQSNPRTDYSVTGNITVQAYFGPTPPTGSTTFVTNLLAKASIPAPADPFVQIFVEPEEDAYTYGFQTHGTMSQAHWESVFQQLGHLSAYALINPYWTGSWVDRPGIANGLRGAAAVGRQIAGGIAKLPTNSVEQARIRALYSDPVGLSMAYFFHDAEEEMIDQVAGGNGFGRLRGATWALNTATDASLYTAATTNLDCSATGRLRSFTVQFGLFAGNDMYGNWPNTRLVASGNETNGWRIEYLSTGSQGSNSIRFVSYKNGVAAIASSPDWPYSVAHYWRTVTVTATTNPGDAEKLDVEVKVEPVGDDTVYTRTTTVSRTGLSGANQLFLLTTRAQSAAYQMRDLDDFILRDYAGTPIVSYDFEPAMPGEILATAPIGTVPDRSGFGHDLFTPAGTEQNYTRRPTHGITPETKAAMGQWLVDELLTARTAASQPPPQLINNWRISETPGHLAAWMTEGFTHGGTEAYWLNPILTTNENPVIWLARRGGAPTRFAWADGSDWSQIWLGVEYRSNPPLPDSYQDLIALQVLQGVRWFVVFTPMSFGHLGSQALDMTDPIAMANINADAIHAMCRAASWYQSTAASLADSTRTEEQFGNPAIGADTLYLRRDNATTREAWFAAIKVAGTGTHAVNLPALRGTVRNLKTGVTTAITNGQFSLPLTPAAEPHHFAPGPPVFAGLAQVTAGIESATLSWSAATGACAVTYHVYVATTSGGQDFNVALLSTNALSVNISPLSPGNTGPTTYYFIVRASDACGGMETNLMEYAVQPLLDSNKDQDGDGQSNGAELLSGTDPWNAGDSFRVTQLRWESNGVRVVWQTAGGRTNEVWAAPDLAGPFTNLSSWIIISNTGPATTNYLDAGAATNQPARFYRIRLVP